MVDSNSKASRMNLRYLAQGRYASTSPYPNRADVVRTAAAVLLRSGYASRSYRQSLQDVVEGNEHGNELASRDWFNSELELGQHRVTFYLKMDSEFSSFERDTVTDKDGNKFCKLSLKCEVNWAGVGSQSVAETLMYAKLLNIAAECAAEVEATYSGRAVYSCYKTAAAVAEAEAQALADHRRSTMSRAVESCKGMRVSKSKIVSLSMADMPAAFPVGADCVVEARGKRYVVKVAETYAGTDTVDLFVMRTA